MRFRFEPDALEVVIGKQADKSENAFVGGENRWRYDTFVNWEVSLEGWVPCCKRSIFGLD